MLKQLTQEDQKVYGGIVKQLDSENFDEFFIENQLDFSEGFRDKYLEQLSIPVKFFNCANDKLQHSILVTSNSKFYWQK